MENGFDSGAVLASALLFAIILLTKLLIPMLSWGMVGLTTLLLLVALLLAWFVKPWFAYRRMKAGPPDVIIGERAALSLGTYYMWPDCQSISLVRGDMVHILQLDSRKLLIENEHTTFAGVGYRDRRDYLPVPLDRFAEGVEAGKKLAEVCGAVFRCETAL